MIEYYCPNCLDSIPQHMVDRIRGDDGQDVEDAGTLPPDDYEIHERRYMAPILNYGIEPPSELTRRNEATMFVEESPLRPSVKEAIDKAILAMTAEQAPKPKPEPPSELAILATLVRQIIEAINGNAWMGMAAVRTAKELEAELWNLDQPAK